MNNEYIPIIIETENGFIDGVGAVVSTETFGGNHGINKEYDI